MRAKPYSTIVVRVPAELRSTLDAIAEARGEPLALTIRDALRAAVADRHVDGGTQITAASAPVTARDYK